jgi:HKD family nuclease
LADGDIEAGEHIRIRISLAYKMKKSVIICKEKSANPTRLPIEVRHLTGKALDILTICVLKTMVNKNFISEMEVPL